MNIPAIAHKITFVEGVNVSKSNVCSLFSEKANVLIKDSPNPNNKLNTGEPMVPLRAISANPLLDKVQSIKKSGRAFPTAKTVIIKNDLETSNGNKY